MSNGYIKKSIDAVKKYLAEKQSVDELLGQTDKVKPIIMESDYWKYKKKTIWQVLRYNVCINKKDIVKKPEDGLIGYQPVVDEVVGYKYSIQDGSVIADLCNAFKVDIPQDLTTKFGQKLASEFEEISNSVNNYDKALSQLHQTLKEKISKTLDIGVNTELSDDHIYQIVSRLPDYEEESKKLLLKSHRKTNGVENPDAKLEQPAPDLFKLLGDEDLKTHIDNYRQKPLEERAKDPLRMIFRCNRSTQNYKLDNITKNKAIKQWFEESINKTLAKKDKEDIYFVLLELFGKDFEFGGNYDIPKAKLWDKVDEKEVREWYRKNMPDTDLFDDLKKIEKKDDLNINIVENNLNENNIDVLEPKNEYDKEKDKPNKIGDSFDESGFKSKEINTDIEINRNRSKRKRKKSKTSNLVYKIGLFLDILITALLVYLAIKISLLFLISLVVTLPIGIFCAIKLCQGCLSVDNQKIQSPSISDDGFLYSETHEPEDVPNLNENYGLENGGNNNNDEKPVIIFTKN